MSRCSVAMISYGPCDGSCSAAEWRSDRGSSTGRNLRSTTASSRDTSEPCSKRCISSSLVSVICKLEVVEAVDSRYYHSRRRRNSKCSRMSRCSVAMISYGPCDGSCSAAEWRSDRGSSTGRNLRSTTARSRDTSEPCSKRCIRSSLVSVICKLKLLSKPVKQPQPAAA